MYLNFNPSLNLHEQYDGYLKREAAEVEKSKREDGLPIPRGFPYERITGLSREAAQRLGEVEPRSLGQARRVPGVTPAAVALVAVFLKRTTDDASGVLGTADEAGSPGEPHD